MRRLVSALAVCAVLNISAASAAPAVQVLDGGAFGLLPAASFGRAVALSGDRLVVGAPYALHDPSHLGEVLLFCLQNDAWVHVGTLTNSANGGPFGFAVALGGRRLAVGMSGAPDSYARFYDWPDCDSSPKLTASVGRSLDLDLPMRSIYAISIDGDRVALGDPQLGGDVGVVHVVSIGQGFAAPHLDYSIGATDGGITAKTAFGHAVVLRAETLMVGADKDEGLPARPGAMFGAVYRFADRQLQSVIGRGRDLDEALDPADFFGAAASVSGGVLYVGAPGDDGPTESDGFGAVHVIPLDGSPEWTIGWSGDVNVPLGKWDRFGYAVSADGDRLAVGAPQNDAPTPQPGKVFVFSGLQAP